MNPAVVFGLVATALYLFATVLVYRQFRGTAAPSRMAVILPGSVAVICHAIALFFLMETGHGLRLGLFPIASAVAMVGAALVIVSSFYRPFEWLASLVYPFAAIMIPASLWINTGYIARPLEHGIGLHILFSIVSYAVLALSACQAILLLIQHRQLKHGNLHGVMRVFPPIQVMESMLFDTIWLGEALLTVAIVLGFLYVDNLFAQHLVHKTILSLLSWVIFAVLLGGRHLRGWRGLTAIRFTLSGFAILVVAFFGTQLVLEIILHRI